MAEFNLVVVTPETTSIQTSASFVALPAIDGEMGIMPGHAPVIARLGFGEMRIETDGQPSRYYVDGGFAQITSEEVSVLTSRAIPVEKIDTAAAKRQLEEAENQKSENPEQEAVRQKLISQARAQLRLVTG